MNKKLLKQLLLISFKNGELDNTIISQIAERLNRKELKIYIRTLKNAQKLQNVYVETPFSVNTDVAREINSVYPDKKVVFSEDPSLIVGTRVTYNDDVFDLSLKNSLDSIIDSIENYD